jgi:hypothetical protein
MKQGGKGSGKGSGKVALSLAALAALALLLRGGSSLGAEPSKPSSPPGAKPPAKIALRKSGVSVDNVPTTIAGAVALARAQGSAELTVTGDAKQGDYDALKSQLRAAGVPFREVGPSVPSTPSTPSTPSMPSTPTTPSTPSMPSTPTIPTTPITPNGSGGGGGNGGDSPPANVPVTSSSVVGEWWRPRDGFPAVRARPFPGRPYVQMLAKTEPADPRSIAPKRDAQVLQWMRDGALDKPEFVKVRVGTRLIVQASRDIVSFGGVRLCCSNVAAQHIADYYRCLLPTTSISDAIWAASILRLAPQKQSPNPGGGVDCWLYQQDRIAAEFDRCLQRALAANRGLAELAQSPIASVIKDYVLTARLFEPGADKKCAIYGWHEPDGKPIQSNMGVDASLPHHIDHIDYSQGGPRLIHPECWVDGQFRELAQVYTEMPELVVKLGLPAPPIRHPGIPRST